MLDELAARSELLRGALDFVFPPLCLGCGEFDEPRDLICPDCLRRIEIYAGPICLDCQEPLPEDLTCLRCEKRVPALYALGAYREPLREVVIQFKFKGISRVAKVLAGMIAAEFGGELTALGADALAPIPLHPGRRSRRGYNQAEKLAEALSRELDLPVANDLVRRTSARKPQAKLELSKRAANVKGAFAVDRSRGEDDPARLILVDDVVTSGATMRETARVLTEAGFGIAGGVAVAHGQGKQ